jgi:long-chain acyl-CoA synthetase
MNRADPRKPFIIVDGKPFSYGAFATRVRKLTRVVAELCDDTRGMAILTRSATEMACLFVAALRAGVPVINVNPDQTPSERAHAMRASGISHVFVDPELDEGIVLPDKVTKTVIEDTVPRKSGLVGKLLGNKSAAAPEPEYARRIAEAAPVEQVTAFDPNRTAILLMSSGTTSEPKIVELSHGNVLAQLKIFLEVYGFTAETRLLNPLPVHFTDGIFHGPLHVLYAGATLYRPSSFKFEELDELLLSIYRDRITHFFIVPTILALINALPDSFDDAFDTPDFKMIRTAGDRLSVPLWEAFEKRFSVKVSDEYGLSETSCAATYCVPEAGTYKRGTIGKPVGCTVRIVTAEGEDVAPGDIGELLIRGETIAKGYRNNPELTQKAFRDGWLRSGDLARMDDDGFLVITGRASGIIISGGININPADVSDVLLQHPDVADAAAFGVEDPTLGEKVVAAVAFRPAEAGDKSGLVEFCKARLAPHKIPRDIMVLEEIPRTLSGKPLIRKLRETFVAGQTGGPESGKDLAEGVILLASEVFNCNADDLSLASAPKSTAGWDSFAHVQLVLEAERRYGVTIPPREFLNIRTLKDLVQVLEKQNGTPGS